jgi:hypothetical protein
MDKAWRGRITAVQALGDDLKIVLDPRSVERADTEGQVG